MLIQKIKAINALLAEADIKTSAFSAKSGISCIPGCGKCCASPTINASSPEFLPAAFSLYKQERILGYLEKLQGSQPGNACIFFNPFSAGTGNCEIYESRGLVCRLFGYSTRLNKNSEPNLITCQPIKQTSQYQRVSTAHLKSAPNASALYTKLSSIDIREANNIRPVNEAIRIAMEEVLLYFSFRRKRPA